MKYFHTIRLTLYLWMDSLGEENNRAVRIDLKTAFRTAKQIWLK